MRDRKLRYFGRATPPAAPTVPPVPYTLRDGWNARDIEHFMPSAPWTVSNRLRLRSAQTACVARHPRDSGVDVVYGTITPPPRHWRLICHFAPLVIRTLSDTQFSPSEAHGAILMCG